MTFYSSTLRVFRETYGRGPYDPAARRVLLAPTHALNRYRPLDPRSRPGTRMTVLT